MSKSLFLRAAAVTLALGIATTAQAADVTGAGASFIYPILSKSADYAAATGKKINYQSIGSGGGIAQIKAGTVDFGSSDKPLSPEELEKAGPMGAIALWAAGQPASNPKQSRPCSMTAWDAPTDSSARLAR